MNRRGFLRRVLCRGPLSLAEEGREMTVRSRTGVEVETSAPTTTRPARLWRQVVARLMQLPPARYEVGVERDIPVTMPDGAVLRTDRYWPQTPGPYPTVLVRTPYGRGLEAPGFN